MEELEHRARRRDILVDDETLFAFYDERVGAEVVSAGTSTAGGRRHRATDPDLLTFTEAAARRRRRTASTSRLPDRVAPGWPRAALTYQFEPGTEADGVTVHIPLRVLNQVAAGFDWQVPGLRGELVTALIRSLPKAVRRNFVPVPVHGRVGAGRAPADARRPAHGGAEARLRRLTGVVVAPRGLGRGSRCPTT